MIDGWTNHLWQSTLFGVLAGLMTLGFRTNRAEVRYWLWFSASFKFLVPFWMLISVGSHLGWEPAARMLTAPAVPVAIGQATPPPQAGLPTPAAANDARSRFAEELTMIGVGLWACGFSAVAFIRLRDWLRIRAAVKSSTPMDLPATVEVRSCGGLLEPGVVGWFHPILLLPADIVERLTPPQMGAVLAHEMYHVRRRDNLLASIHMIVEATFWFHPLVWWIGARLVEERERACDEQVLRMGSEPRVYAEAILKICKLYVESPLVCVSGVTGADLGRRLEAIMSDRIGLRLSFAKKLALSIAGAGAVAMPVGVGMINAPSIRAQTVSESGAITPRFEVASIRPCRDDPGFKRGRGYSSSPGRLNTGCMPLVDSANLGLIQRAYVRFADGRPHWPGIIPIQGGPAWIRSELYAISAKAEGNPSQGMMEGPMLRILLEERFKLKIHRETREVRVYALTVAQGGPRLKPFEEGSCTAMPLTVPPPKPDPGQRYCKTLVGLRPPAVNAEGSTLAEFSKLLDLVLDRPVIDKTGIAGRFDMHLEFAIDEATSGLRVPLAEFGGAQAMPPEHSAPSIFTAIQEQLGLKLVPAKGPQEFLVIDHVERPGAN